MLGLTATSRAKRVDFVDEDGAGRVKTRHVEENAHQFFRLTTPLASETGARDVEEGSATFRSNSFGQERFAGAWRSYHQYALGIQKQYY